MILAIVVLLSQSVFFFVSFQHFFSFLVHCCSFLRKCNNFCSIFIVTKCKYDLVNLPQKSLSKTRPRACGGKTALIHILYGTDLIDSDISKVAAY